MEDQLAFADLSGDYNPMHIDEIVARRTQAGAPVVHGVHVLFWALESLASVFDDLPSVGVLRADFKSFLVIGREANWTAETSGEQTRVTVLADAVKIMSVQLHRGARNSPAESVSYPWGPVYSPSQTPLDLIFSQMQDMRGETPFFRKAADYSGMFPNLADWIGATRIAALACATRIVGMVCPGQHSIFNRIEASFVETDDKAALQFAVTQADEQFSRVGIAAKGGGLAAVLTTTVRPSPVEQPGMSEIAQCVEERAFKGANTLVIGGSRGLGELTAKYLAAGGARVTITYAVGRSDAERVAAEIKAFGRSCDVTAFDARRPAKEQLEGRASTFTHVYYFATPKTIAQNVKFFDNERFDLYFAFYVRSFVDLCECLNSETESRVHVLYPSSTWVQKDERPSGWAEYVMAKAAGEVICDDLSRRMKHVHVTSVRLPRLPTDQTASIVRAEQKASSLEVMSKLISVFQVDYPG
jgi:NAD(P)-dependent dehydrogenase (short-subunit alcohol dehydrogenase family)